MHIRALAGVNVVHLFIFCRALLLFQVAHVGGLFYFLMHRIVKAFRLLTIDGGASSIVHRLSSGQLGSNM